MDIIIRIIGKYSIKKLLFAILLIAIILRIWAITYFGFGLSGQDLFEYGQIAENLFKGTGFTRFGVEPTCVMSPIYPGFMALSYTFFGMTKSAYIFIQLFQTLIGALTIIPIFSIGKRIFSNEVGLLSAIVVAVFPDFIYSAYALHPVAFSTFAISVLIYYSLIWIEKRNAKNSIILGVLFGIALLLEPAIVSIFILLIFALIFYKDKRTNSKLNLSLLHKLKMIFLIIFACSVFISPWLVRNYYAAGEHFIFLKHSGYNLWRGNNPEFSETGSPPGFNANLTNDMEEKSEYNVEKRLKELAYEYILNHKVETLKGYIFKTYQFWWFPEISPHQSPLLRKILYAPLLLLLVIGIYMKRKSLPDIYLLLAPLVGFNLLYALTFVLPRYRIPIEPLMFILSMYALLEIFKYIKVKMK